ncbi:potassium-transporting ATPase subunit C [Actinoallomurus bryophytorum]|uniref:Potassium-transporting ATPase KdpC subunit n=1 Tax=Actinoallomurus bryophytorum TaxID=1490222 RepID=A0A543CS74_9ACTN|nr:potassium-transporting ATPase subunit C [Actinoallomurus bryophytorum]TQL99850.1 K+-transporting ATPase ATPase C chain [Actinoallomurus bryophytorum]
MRLPSWLRQHLAALRALLVLTVILGIVYPVAIWVVAFIPGLHGNAEGSMIKAADGKVVGSRIIGQAFTDSDGNALKQYFQSRPSDAGDGYDPTATAAGNLGPESIVDTLPDPKLVAAGKEDENAKTSLLTQVCTRSADVAKLEGVDGSRPFCTPGGVGAVLALIGPRDRQGHVTHPTQVISLNEECGVVNTPFVAAYKGVAVQCAKYGEDYTKGEVVPIRGGAPAHPTVPADAVTASGSGLDPHISPAYARLQAPRIAKTRGVPETQVLQAIKDNEDGRVLGFIGDPRVNVLKLNIELDKKYPFRG